MKKIKLTKGLVAIVDDSDYENVNQFKWQGVVEKCKFRTHFSVRRSVLFNGKRRTLPMAKFILGLKPGKKIVADHINGNGLDNRRCNLRAATMSQNQQNKSRQLGYSSKYKGVSYYKPKDLWVASIMVNGKIKHLKYSKIEKVVALVYDREAIKRFGKFAKINFPALLPRDGKS